MRERTNAAMAEPRLPAHYFTQLNELILGLGVKSAYKFVIYATDYTNYWLASYRFTHLEQKKHSAQTIFDALCTSFDTGDNAGSSYVISEDSSTIALELVFTLHGTEHRSTYSLQRIGGEEGVRMIGAMIPQLYRTMQKWRLQVKTHQKFRANRTISDSRHIINPTEGSLLSPASNSSIPAMFPSPPKLRSGMDVLTRAEAENALQAMDHSARLKGWKPVNNASRGLFGTPEYLQSRSPTHQTRLVSLSLGSKHNLESPAVQRQRCAETKEQLQLKFLKQKQELLTLQENTQFYFARHKENDQDVTSLNAVDVNEVRVEPIEDIFDEKLP